MSIQQEAVALALPETYSNPKLVNQLMAKVQNEQPVCRVEPEGYRPMWLVTRHQDIEYVESKPEVFLAEPRTVIQSIELEQEIAALGVATGLTGMDGDMHRKYRRLAQAWFMPRNLKTLEGSVAEMAKKYVDLLESKAPSCDFATDVAFWYPLRVVLGLAGVPEEADATIVKLTQAFFGEADNDLMLDEQLSMTDVLTRFGELLVPLIEDRRANPGDDLMSAIVNAEIDGRPVSTEELIGYLTIVVTAGHDTTSASLAGGLMALIENPEELQKLRENPELISSAVEEMFRWVAPVKHFARTAVEDIEVGGETIRKGDSLMLLFAAACRDEAVLSDAEQFRVDRERNKHMAFGFGPHMCMGRYLAKMEIEAYLKELLPRLESVELNGEPKYLASNIVSGLKSLPIKFSFK